MPNEKQHVQWAMHNIDVLNYIAQQKNFCDWTATVSFYTALHIIEAVFYNNPQKGRGRHGVCHENRMNQLKNIKKYQKIYRHYRVLYSASRVARYIQDDNGNPIFFQGYMSHDEVLNVLIQHDLRQIMNSISKLELLGEPISKDLMDTIEKLPKVA